MGLRPRDPRTLPQGSHSIVLPPAIHLETLLVSFMALNVMLGGKVDLAVGYYTLAPCSPPLPQGSVSSRDTRSVWRHFWLLHKGIECHWHLVSGSQGCLQTPRRAEGACSPASHMPTAGSLVQPRGSGCRWR